MSGKDPTPDMIRNELAAAHSRFSFETFSGPLLRTRSTVYQGKIKHFVVTIRYDTSNVEAINCISFLLKAAGYSFSVPNGEMPNLPVNLAPDLGFRHYRTRTGEPFVDWEKGTHTGEIDGQISSQVFTDRRWTPHCRR